MSWNSGRRRCQLNNNRHAALPWLPVADLGELVRTAYIDGAGLAEDPKGPLGVMESGHMARGRSRDTAARVSTVRQDRPGGGRGCNSVLG